MEKPIGGGPAGPLAAPASFLSSRAIFEMDHYLEIEWIRDRAQTTRYSAEQVLDRDQILLTIGMDWTRPQQLGATSQFYLGGRPILFNTTTSIFIPKGTPHGPLSWKEFTRPYLQLSLVLGSRDPFAGNVGNAREARSDAPAPSPDIDYEQYVIRSPMREAGPEHVEGRQNPTMTYMSRTQIPEATNYIEFGWIWNVPRPPIPKMRHDDYDEIVLHIGSDPAHPEDLGGVLQFGVGEDLLELETTHCVYCPKGLDHGPLKWKEVRRPLIEMAIMLGASTLAEGWENSFFDLPDGARRGPK